MQLPETHLDRGNALGRRLDNELLFPIFFHRTLPPVKRGHGRQHVHAGREPFADECPRERGCIR